jgi:5-methyltetrahydrofolate--homocysteine methyltransferase
MLMSRGLKAGDCPESFNLTNPAMLSEIAALYLEAGAELITTNTFGGSPLRLACYSLEEETDAINRSAVEAVRATVDGGALVLASVGPSGKLLLPYGDTKPEVVASAFERQIRALIEAGADIICVETMIDLTEAVLAIQASKSLMPKIPVMATMTFEATSKGFFTAMGVTIQQAVKRLTEAGADIVGSNCGNGIERMVEIAREFRQHSRLPVAIQSNAGLPVNRSGKIVYPETPEIMAAGVRKLLDLGVSIIGGCCGTGPEHIRAFAEVVNEARQ